jgi:outer membrane protein OmpA-like peptidoglycan-associated protein
MGWNAQMGIMYAVGGKQTSAGSICQEMGLNVQLDVQNNTGKQAEDLYAFAQGYVSGDQSKGCHFIGWMGDGVPNYLKGLNDRLKKDFGEEYQAVVIGFAGASFGEDKWMLKPKYAKDARGSLTCTVIRDGDWNIAVIKSQTNGWPINYDLGTYDPTKVNFVSAPNDDYMEAAKFYASGQKVTLKLVKNGKITDTDTTLACTGVSTWFPGDYEAVKQKGGLVVAASTADYSAQMACALVCIKKWAKDNRKVVENLIEAIGRGGDQVKSHDLALRFGCKVAQMVFADDNITEDDYYKAYTSFDLTDDDGNTVKIGGSRVFNLADACNYVGITGGQDKYKTVYNTFGNICKESYPEILSDFIPYEEATDWSFLKAVYLKNKSDIGTISKTDFNATDQVREVVGDANYAIEFEIGSAVIRPSSYPILNKIADQLTIADNLLVEIAGHTDNTGSPETNASLSKARAQSVANYIIARDPGSFSSRISSSRVKGWGPSKPIADNLTVEGRQKNRRVEIKLGRK